MSQTSVRPLSRLTATRALSDNEIAQVSGANAYAVLVRDPDINGPHGRECCSANSCPPGSYHLD